MSREIKFRAYHNRANKMLESGTVRQVFSWKDEGQDISIMQYTGLKDKNGKEIYEGDIVIDVLTKCRLQIHFGYNRNGGYTGWYVSYLNIDKNGFSSISGDYDTNINSQIEIIGNIYENPNLL